MAHAMSAKASIAARAVVAPAKAPKAQAQRLACVCSAEQPAQLGRRAAAGALAGAFALSMRADEAQAAYGQSANVFKSSKETSDGDFSLYTADNYSILIPQRGYNPSPPEYLSEWPGIDLRWEDFNSTDYANVTITVKDGEKTLEPQDLAFMFGESTWAGFGEYSSTDLTKKQGESSAIFAANVLEKTNKTVDGKNIQIFELLTRTVDGSQGGRHHLIAAGTKGGKTYIAKYTCGDKHWAANRKTAFKVRDSFKIA